MLRDGCAISAKSSDIERHRGRHSGDQKSWYLRFLGRGHSLRQAAMPQMSNLLASFSTPYARLHELPGLAKLRLRGHLGGTKKTDTLSQSHARLLLNQPRAETPILLIRDRP
jgi:hypothetical protein